jgi:hypothetical protein
MKRLIPFFLLLAGPALAQQPAPASQRATEILLNRAIVSDQSDLVGAIQLQDQVAALTKQVADLTKERDALKTAEKAPPAPADAPPK